VTGMVPHKSLLEKSLDNSTQTRDNRLVAHPFR
jgi:hypothetical protein